MGVACGETPVHSHSLRVVSLRPKLKSCPFFFLKYNPDPHLVVLSSSVLCALEACRVVCWEGGTVCWFRPTSLFKIPVFRAAKSVPPHSVLLHPTCGPPASSSFLAGGVVIPSQPSSLSKKRCKLQYGRGRGPLRDKECAGCLVWRLWGRRCHSIHSVPPPPRHLTIARPCCIFFCIVECVVVARCALLLFY